MAISAKPWYAQPLMPDSRAIFAEIVPDPAVASHEDLDSIGQGCSMPLMPALSVAGTTDRAVARQFPIRQLPRIGHRNLA